MKTLPANRKASASEASAIGKSRSASVHRTRETTLKIDRVLVPVDFSPHSKKALGYALGLAKRFGAEVTLLHVVEQIFYPSDWIYPFTTVDFPARCEALIKEAKSWLKEESGTNEPVVLLGNPWREIVDLAKKRKMDLIIIGTHGHTGLKHALLGSVAEKVVRHASCPVLTVRTGK